MVPLNSITPKPGVLAKQAVLKWLQTPEQERSTIQKAAEDGGVSKQVFSYHYTLLTECGQAQLLAHSLASEGAAPVQKKGRSVVRNQRQTQVTMALEPRGKNTRRYLRGCPRQWLARN
jgi:hypothetical protein